MMAEFFTLCELFLCSRCESHQGEACALGRTNRCREKLKYFRK